MNISPIIREKSIKQKSNKIIMVPSSIPTIWSPNNPWLNQNISNKYNITKGEVAYAK